MKIQIAQRLQPFSHTPGACCVIPGSWAVLEAYPTLLRMSGHEYKLPILGPVTGFTVQQDLEKHCVFVFGKTSDGYFRLRIEATESGFSLKSERGKLGDAFLQTPLFFSKKSCFERLSLGVHKAQDWDLMQRRADLKEILPLLFSLGQNIPRVDPQPLQGTAKLLALSEERTFLYPRLEAFFKAGFKSFLIPRLEDDQHQGYIPEEKTKGNPFFLLQEGAAMIRSLFFQQKEQRIAFLPHLPIPFDAGRMLGIQAPGIGEIDFEWSKKTLRRVVLRASFSGEIILELPREIKTFRVNRKKKMNKIDPILLEAKTTLLLDRFER